MRVCRVVLCIVDHDDIGEDAVREELENGHYGNDCISPTVMAIESRDVTWSDDHPLNMVETFVPAFEKLFGPDAH